jgi:hypothetical protein
MELPSRNIPGTHFCQRLSRPQGHSVAGRIRQIEKIHLIRTLTRDLPVCSIVPQPTKLQRAPNEEHIIWNLRFSWRWLRRASFSETWRRESGRSLTTFRRKLLLPSLVSTTKPGKQAASNKQNKCMGFEVFTSVSMKPFIVWDAEFLSRVLCGCSNRPTN